MSVQDYFLSLFSWVGKINKPLTFKGLLSASITAFVVLYAQDSSISFFKTATNNHYSLFLAGVSSFTFFLVFGVSEVIKRGLNYYKDRKKTRKQFESLSLVQKAILKVFIDHGSNTEQFTSGAGHRSRLFGELDGLVELGIIQEAGGTYYSIEPWAREYLNNNYDLIEEADKNNILKIGGDFSVPKRMDVLREEKASEDEEIPF